MGDGPGGLAPSGRGPGEGTEAGSKLRKNCLPGNVGLKGRAPDDGLRPVGLGPVGREGDPGSLGPDGGSPGGLRPDAGVPGGLSPDGGGPGCLRPVGGSPGGLRPNEGSPDGVGVCTGGLKPGALGPGATGAEAVAGALVPGVAPPPPCLAWMRADLRILTS